MWLIGGHDHFTTGLSTGFLQGMAGCAEPSRCAWLSAWARPCGSSGELGESHPVDTHGFPCGVSQWGFPVGWKPQFPQFRIFFGSFPRRTMMILIIKLFVFHCVLGRMSFCFWMIGGGMFKNCERVGFGFLKNNFKIVLPGVSRPKSSGENPMVSRWFTWWSFNRMPFRNSTVCYRTWHVCCTSMSCLQDYNMIKMSIFYCIIIVYLIEFNVLPIKSVHFP